MFRQLFHEESFFLISIPVYIFKRGVVILCVASESLILRRRSEFLIILIQGWTKK